MANVATAVTVDEVTDAIVEKLAERLGTGWTVQAYPEERSDEDEQEVRPQVPVPWATVELMEINVDPDTDPMTDQSAQTCRFRARLIVDGFPSGAKRLVRSKASDLLLWLRCNRMGLTIGEAKAIGAAKDDFTPELEQYEVWYVDWTHLIHVGPGNEDPDQFDAEFPTEVYAGVAPEIGPPNIDKYVKLDYTPEVTGG